MPEENANPSGSENQAPIDIEAAFDDYLQRQAEPAGEEGDDKQPAPEAEAGQSESEAKQDAPESAETEEQRFTVKVNGEEREIPLSELLKGYQLESDYRIKTSQVAEQARAAQAQFQHAQQMQEQYAQALQVYGRQLQQMQPQAPDPALIDADPVAYLRQQQAFQNWQGQMQRVQIEQSQMSAMQQQEESTRQQQALANETDLLLKAIPEWSDKAKAQAGKNEVSKYLKEVIGFNDIQVSAVEDHRAVLLARKAMLYDQLMSKQANVTEKVAKLPPKAPQRSGGGDTSPTDGRTRAMQNLKRSGSIDDAANAFAAMLAR